MTVPLCILAVLSVVSGGVLPDAALWFEHRVHSEHLVTIAAGADRVLDHVSHTVHEFHWTLSAVSLGLFLTALALAFSFFIPRGPLYGREKGVASALSPLYVSLQNLWYLDRFYTWLVLHVLHTCQVICGHFDRVFVDGFVNFWGSVCRFFTGAAGVLDYWGVDGLVRGIGNSALAGGRRLRRLQTGFLQEYVYASLYLSGGLLLLVLVFYVLVK